MAMKERCMWSGEEQGQMEHARKSWSLCQALNASLPLSSCCRWPSGEAFIAEIGTCTRIQRKWRKRSSKTRRSWEPGCCCPRFAYPALGLRKAKGINPVGTAGAVRWAVVPWQPSELVDQWQCARVVTARSILHQPSKHKKNMVYKECTKSILWPLLPWNYAAKVISENAVLVQRGDTF